MRLLGDRVGVLILPVLMVVMSGCVYVTGQRTYWKDEYETLSSQGFGSACEDSFQQYSHNKYDEDDGRCWSVGLFPGFAQGWRGSSYGKFGKGSLFCVYPLGFVLGHVLLACPTISSLLYQPFSSEYVDFSISEVGLIGVHRWKEPGHSTKIVERGVSEQFVRAGSKRFGEYKGGIGMASDHTKVYFSYPGFEVLKDEVDRVGRAYVLYDNDLRIRHFMKARQVEDALAWQDRDASGDEELQLQIEFRNECAALRERANRESKQGKDEEIRQYAARAVDDIGEMMNSAQIADLSYRKNCRGLLKDIVNVLDGKHVQVSTESAQPKKVKSEFDL